MFVLNLFFSSMLLFAGALSLSHGRKRGQIDSMSPYPTPRWVPCYDSEFTCTNLRVPLDYNNETAGTTNIAYIKHQSWNPQAQDIIFHPGGPGVSGVDMLRNQAFHLSELLGEQYNIISFDPRGVGQSGITLSCPSSTKNEDASRRNRKSARRRNNTSKFESAKAKAESCSAFNRYTDAKYAGTVANAQDMAHFLDVSGISDLWYFGVSYGTALGQTFAAMFPDRVGRMVLDSNVDATEWYTGFMPHIFSSADDALEYFFVACHLIGPICEYFETNQEAMRNRFMELLESLKEKPPTYHGVEVTDAYTMLIKFLYMSMYSPVKKFPEIPRVLISLERGDVEPLLSFDQNWTGFDPNALDMIMKIDSSVNFPIKTPEQYLAARQEYERQSQWLGGTLADETLLGSIGFDLAPPPSQRFPGFNQNGIITKHPILFVNQLYDAVTSISNAFTVSKHFPGSRVLAQSSAGHSMAGTPSECTERHVLRYFDQGDLPPPETTCRPDKVPFFGFEI
jgi:pimeloyl-ACP methyl ester carboxylesterase